MKRFWSTLNRRNGPGKSADAETLPRAAIKDADVIISPNEVTDQHGTGVIISRIFGESPNILSIRSASLYSEHSLGAHRLLLPQAGLSRSESFARTLSALNGSTVRRILCVPYHPDELVTAITLKELFGAPLCVFVMDDNNIFCHGVSDELFAEALTKATLRLAISPEMRDEYEKKYHEKFYVVPPVVRHDSVRTTPQSPAAATGGPVTGALIGSLWSREWLQLLRDTVKKAGLQVDWYGNSQAPWLQAVEADLRQDGIIIRGFTPELELTERLKEYPYALIPSGTLDEKDDRPEIARLSLPTRLPYLLAAANMPMIVLGSPATAAARFVERFRVGRVTPYDGPALRKAVEEICQPERQRELRVRAATQSTLFSAKGLADWIWQSLDRGEPVDDRFEAAFRRSRGEIIAYLDHAPPRDLSGDFILVYQALRRLKEHVFIPDFILDVGSSSGVWSDVAHRVFPKARFILVDPLHEHYFKNSDWYFKKHPEFECVPVALSDRPGEAEFGVSGDLYGSSLFRPADFRSYQPVKVPVRTLDDLAREKKFVGRGLLKIDVQFAEHLVLAGAKELLPQVDALLVELSMFQYASQAVLFPEMCEMIHKLGFSYYEDTGGWRCPVDGTTLQKDVLFVRENLVNQSIPGLASTAKPASVGA